jgi:hypothetical protein
MLRRKRNDANHARTYFPERKVELSNQRAEPPGALAQVAGILKTLDTGRYDDKNGLNKVRNETTLVRRMLGRCIAERTGRISAGMGWMVEGTVG